MRSFVALKRAFESLDGETTVRHPALFRRVGTGGETGITLWLSKATPLSPLVVPPEKQGSQGQLRG